MRTVPHRCRHRGEKNSGIPVDAAVVGIIRSTTFPVVESKVMQEINRCTSVESCIKRCRVDNSLNIDPRFAVFLIARIGSMEGGEVNAFS